MKPLDHIIDIILAILVFFLFPLVYFSMKQDALTQTVSDTGTKSLVEEVRSDGYLTKERYGEFLDGLSRTGLTYDIALEHWMTVQEPEYRFRTPGEVIDLQDSQFPGSNVYHYVPVTTDNPEVTDPVYTGSLNTETNESVMASAVNTGSSPTHIHTEACYTGHKHTERSTYTHYHKHTYGCQYWTTYVYWMGECANCHTYYCWQAQFWQSNQPTGGWHGGCSNCGLEGYRVVGKDKVTVEKFWTCGYNIDRNGDGVNDDVGFENEVAYPGQTLPQSFKGGTLVDGCHSFHQCVSSGSGQPNMSGGILYSYIAHYDPYYYRDLGWINPPTERYFSNIFAWSQEMINRYNGVVCYAPESFQYSVEGNDSDIALTGHRLRNANITFKTAVINGTLMFSYKFNISEWVYGKNQYGQEVIIADNNYTLDSLNGDFTKQYLTLYDLAGMLNTDLLVKVNEFLVDKNSPAARTIMFSRLPYTSTEKYWEWYEDGSGGWNSYEQARYIYTEGQPIIGYLRNYMLYENRVGYHYGNVSTCTFVGEKNKWIFNCGKTEDATLDCGSTVTSITPTHPVQVVYQNDPLITTVVVTYADGSVATLVATTDFSTANLCQEQTATLTHTYPVDGVSHTKTCTITISVVPRSKTCPNGHVYNLEADGSDPGCPYCRVWLFSLKLVTPADGKLTIYRGTTLEQNGVELLATYLDGHREAVTGGYVDNLDNGYIGIQTVTIGYKGKTVTVIVTVKRNLTKCTVCGRFYELYPDDSDPGCPYCAARTPIFTGSVMEYKKKKFTEDILKELYEGTGIYYFSRGDYFKISLANSSRSLGGKLSSFVHRTLPEQGIRAEDGGYIRENGQ
ncbi:MAG TPA: hypothetical protein GXX75_25825 [Clostridiales bacterium]|nr:hypothetical protein [Clostridiales bacterium]